MLQDVAEYPSIGELVDVLDNAQIAHETGSNGKTVGEILTELFTLKYPHVQIHRPNRFLDTVKR